MENKKVLLGMSGGVDSSVAALLLKEQGYEVIGTTLELYKDENSKNNVNIDAKNTCDDMGIQHYCYDYTSEFKKRVIDDFINCYANCKTPNPCIECNRYMKFGVMYEIAKNLGCNYIATGHYAKTEYSEKYNRWVLKKSNAGKKDQSYVLWNIPKEVIEHILFPLADFENKDQIREIANKNNLKVANKPDSEDICFVSDGNYKKFLENNSTIKPKEGNIVNSKGEILGKHTGLYNYTIGQRKGLGISNKVPLFVLGFNKEKNEVIVGEEHELYKKEILVADINLLLVDKIEGEMKVETKVIDNKDIIKNMKKRLIISIVFLIPLMYIAMNHMLYEWFGIPIPQFIKNIFHGSQNAINFAFSQLLLLIPIVYVNRNYFIVGFKRLIKRTPNMDSLIAIGATSAILYGIYAIYMISYGLGHNQIELVNKYSMDIYFESAGTILTLITVGKYLETKSKGKTADAISKLINLAPKTVTVIREDKEQKINLEEIIVNDIILVKPGERIGVDGIIIEGNSSIDQSSITGESIPVEKKIGDSVISGTINRNSSFKMKAVKVGNDTTLAQIIKLVEEASNSKAPISRLADRVSGIFVPCVILIAIVATIFWILNGQSFEFALGIGIAVLVISCPCALGLATPVAIMVGTGKGAENGILIKSAESLEMLHLVDTVVLDKTGTITVGKPKVTDIISKIEEKELLKIAGSLEKNSEHPLAEAVIEKVKQDNIEILNIEDFKSVSGKGVIGKIDKKVYYAGNINFMIENNINIIDAEKQSHQFLQEGKTVIYFADENEMIGIIAVADTIKDTSYEAIELLRKQNIKIVMLTGDNKIVANTIGKN